MITQPTNILNILQSYIMQDKPLLIVLSQSLIKKKSIIESFHHNSYNYKFVEVPDNPERASQPLFIDGTKIACNQRMNEYIKKFGFAKNKNEYLVSIENGITTVDETENECKDCLWTDFCIIGIANYKNKREFFISPEMVKIEKIYSKPYFEKCYNQSKEIDTLGKYIAFYHKENYDEDIPHNNWMKYVYNVDRLHQIKQGLRLLKSDYFE
jgi:non-canonical (house-cleaning) NTP pyrophosphatase